MNLLNAFDVLPNPAHVRFTTIAMIWMVLGSVIVSAKSGAASLWPGALALVAVALVLVGFIRASGADNRTDDAASTHRGGRFRFVWFSGGLLVAMSGLLLRGSAVLTDGLLIATPFFFAALLFALMPKHPSAAIWLFPLLISSSIVGVGALMGTTGAVAFPALFALFLGLILQTLRDLESRVTALCTEDAVVHKLMHRRLSWVSVIFFIFGVISLWPWLGKLYGMMYLWILIIGVLFPVMTLWGRLRQPHRDNVLTALARFNRVLPYASLILLLAFVLG
jgi:hypothetical protein